MADYFTPTVVQQTIPNADMTPLERLVLSHVFESELDGDGVYFFSEAGPRDLVDFPVADLEAALAASEGIHSTLRVYVAERVLDLGDTDKYAELDLSGTSWEFILQDIVRRSPTLHYVTVVSSFTCSRMRPDGFGRMAVLITADAILGKSTNDILEDFIAQIDKAARTPPTAA
jgi:hypothetical protein